MRSHADIIEHKAQAQPSQPQTDWSGWDQWLRGHLNIELNSLHRALGQLLAEEREKPERKTSEFAVKLAKLSGAVDVLSGKAPLHAHLDIERETLHRALGEVLATEGAKFGVPCRVRMGPRGGE